MNAKAIKIGVAALLLVVALVLLFRFIGGGSSTVETEDGERIKVESVLR